jgi:hypothetical protein
MRISEWIFYNLRRVHARAYDFTVTQSLYFSIVGQARFKFLGPYTVQCGQVRKNLRWMIEIRDMQS